MSAHVPARFASRDVAARKIAAMLHYKIAVGCVYETYVDFADAIGLPADGSVPPELRVRIEDYTAPPLEPEKETHHTHTSYEED